MAIDPNTQIGPDGKRHAIPDADDTIGPGITAAFKASRLLPGTQIDMVTGRRLPLNDQAPTVVVSF